MDKEGRQTYTNHAMNAIDAEHSCRNMWCMSERILYYNVPDVKELSACSVTQSDSSYHSRQMIGTTANVEGYKKSAAGMRGCFGWKRFG